MPMVVLDIIKTKIFKIVLTFFTSVLSFFCTCLYLSFEYLYPGLYLVYLCKTLYSCYEHHLPVIELK